MHWRTMVVLLAVGCGPTPPASRVAPGEVVPIAEVELPAPAPSPAAAEPEAARLAQDPSTPGPRYGEELVIEEISPGQGPEATEGQRVRLHYDCRLADGTEVDSSRRGQPFEFELGRGHVVRGFEQGVLGMRAGGARKVIVPPDLGYGKQGRSSKIPPDAVLVFELELLEIL